MTTTQSPADLAYLMANDDLTGDELERLMGYVPKEKLSALLGQILFEICATPGAA
jgi:hypothetical protein